MTQIENRLSAVREQMAAAGVNALIVPRADEYLGEYIPEHHERLRWISDFTGSAGLVIVTAKKAVIFVDGRFRIACALKALLYCTEETGQIDQFQNAIRRPVPHCRMMMHDYERSRYHMIEKIGWRRIKLVNKLALFEPDPQNLSDATLSAYTKFLENWL